jgi:hypothetical protein
LKINILVPVKSFIPNGPMFDIPITFKDEHIISPKISPTKPAPFLGRPRGLLTPSPDNSGIELILPCNELVALYVLNF